MPYQSFRSVSKCASSALSALSAADSVSPLASSTRLTSTKILEASRQGTRISTRKTETAPRVFL